MNERRDTVLFLVSVSATAGPAKLARVEWSQLTEVSSVLVQLYASGMRIGK